MYKWPRINIFKPLEVVIDANIYNKPIVVIEDPHDVAYTDGEVIFINIPLVKSIVDNIVSEDKFKDRIFSEVINYIVAHEIMHIVFSDFHYREKYIDLFGRVFGEPYVILFKVIHNILEDSRIEYLMEVYYPALIEQFRKGRELLFEAAIKKEIVYINRIPSSEALILLLLKFLLVFSLTQNIDYTMDILRKSMENDALVNQLWGRIRDMVPLIIALRISQDPKYPLRAAAIITISFQKEIKGISPDSYTGKFIRDLTRKSIVYVINEMIKGMKKKSSIDYPHRSIYGGYENLTPVVSAADYQFYRRISNIYRSYILELQESIKKIYRKWKDAKKFFGNIIEDHLVDVYVWSYTKDEPRPKVFESMEFEMRPLDVLLLIDQSGSMSGEENIAATSAVVISESLSSLVDEDIVRLGIAGFGDYLVYYKRVSWPMSIARIIPRASGGTMAFTALNHFFKNEARHLRRNVDLLIIFFTDSYDCYEDLQIAKSVIANIKNFNRKTTILGLITEQNVQEEFISYLDGYKTLDSINILPRLVVELILSAVRRKRTRRTGGEI